MVLPEPSATENIKAKYEYLNIRKLCFMFVLEENATLEIILYDKLLNMLMFGCRKEERRKFHLTVVYLKINN